MKDQEIKEAIYAAVVQVDGTPGLSCKNAHALSYKYGVDLDKIGKICREENIRLKNCQMGCF